MITYGTISTTVRLSPRGYHGAVKVYDTSGEFLYSITCAYARGNWQDAMADARRARIELLQENNLIP